MTHRANLLNCALAYAARGWAVFPLYTILNGQCSCGNPKCSSPGKHPRLKGGFKNATTDIKQIKKWWSKWPDANIGIRTGKESGLFVLDLDNKTDPDRNGIKSMAALSKKSGPLPITPKVKTGSGGEHYYFEMPKRNVGNSSSKLAGGIDTRANGGYVVAPPSLHISGNEYKWLIDLKAPLATVPKWILTKLGKKIRRKSKKAKKSTGDIKEGQRNEKLTSIAGSLRHKGFELDQIEAELQKINTEKCNPPLGEDEVTSIAESVAKYKPAHAPYRATKKGLFFLKQTSNGVCPVPLTNFTAEIKSSIVQDDGVEVIQSFEIEAKLNDRRTLFSVQASKYASLNWVMEKMGPLAVVYAGYGAKDHARVAVQMLSKHVVSRTIFTHTGWRKINDKFFYLTGTGAIGSDGFVDSIEVGLPDGLEKYSLSESENKADQIHAIRTSLSFLDIVPDHIGFPLYCAIWRSILGRSDYSVHLPGPTGIGKSVLAALVQQHFGSTMCSRGLPGSWSSTANSLEDQSFTIKDAVFVIDDFAPDGTKNDIQRLHKTAARVFRAQGNHTGRKRMRADGSLRAAKPPRGLIISTGEDIPTGQSVRARLLILELSENDLNWQKVTWCQSDAEQGLYEKATFGFIRWLAQKYEEVKKSVPREIMLLRSKATQLRMHKRTPEIIASQYIGMQYFVKYAREVGAIKEDKGKELSNRCWDALGQAGYKQIVFQSAMEPTQRFIELISSAISSGRAHLANTDGEEPLTPLTYGWRKTISGVGSYESEQWIPQGDRIGWIDGENIYLDPDASYRIAQNVGGDQGLCITLGTLKKRLNEKGLIIKENKRETLTVRRQLQGSQHNVLLLRENTLILQKPDIPDNSDDSPNPDDDTPI